MGSIRNQGLIVAGLALSIVPWLIAPSTIAPFIALYSLFGIDPPPATKFLIDHPQSLLVLPLFLMSAWLYPGWKGRRGVASLSVGLLVAALGYLSMVMLLYWPTI